MNVKFEKQSQRDQIIAAFDHAMRLAVDALDTRKCTEMHFELDFCVNHVPKIRSNIEEVFHKD